MKALAESYENQNDSIYTLSEKQHGILDRRRRKHLAGESKTFIWEQVKENARNAKK